MADKEYAAGLNEKADAMLEKYVPRWRKRFSQSVLGKTEITEKSQEGDKIMAKQLLGKEVTAALNERIKAEVAQLEEKGVKPTLGIIRVGENESDISYERGATKRCETLGVACEKILLPADVTQEELLAAVIDDVNKNDAYSRCSAVPSASEAPESERDRECTGSGKGCGLHDRRFHVRRIYRQSRSASRPAHRRPAWRSWITMESTAPARRQLSSAAAS